MSQAFTYTFGIPFSEQPKTMNKLLFSILLLFSFAVQAQDVKPPHCAQPITYGSVASVAGEPGPTPPPLPRFATSPVTEYKVQVALLRYTDPSEYPFHSSLVARYRPCEEIWVVESRDSFASREEAARLQADLKALGYSGAYITELVGYR